MRALLLLLALCLPLRALTYPSWVAQFPSIADTTLSACLGPPRENRLWTYDFTGSWRTRAHWDDAAGIANAAERLRGQASTTMFAEFLE